VAGKKWEGARGAGEVKDEGLRSGLEGINKGRGPGSNGRWGGGIGAKEDVGSEEVGNGGQGTELKECGLGLRIVEAFGKTRDGGGKVISSLAEEGSSESG
jgi:hypothetical protein